MKKSIIEKKIYKNIKMFIKRDDLIHEDFSGNKGRKFYYFLKNEFPQIKKVISYGSMQSNAMYSLSVLAKLKGWEFEYYTRINEEVLKKPVGNLKAALENGMKLKEIRHWTLDIGHWEKNYLSECKIIDDILIIPEGGRCKEAEFGIKLLANEIIEWTKEQKIKNLNIFLPSGTGTTALFLQKHLTNVQCLMSNVYTVPCVGNSNYLKEQFFGLEPNEKFHPIIIESPKKYRFGKLYKELFDIWQELKFETGIEFDLMYDPIGFNTVFTNVQCLMSNDFLYIHQGGLKGNESMIARYQERFGKILK